jgi:maltose alpha-D-glucosyltransferase/alpha-amylase
VFPGVQQTTWTYTRGARKYYFHRFYDFEPDLNIENAQVREEIRRIVGFWLELGVAGFRVDAVPFLLEKPSAGVGRSALDFGYLKELREFLQWRVGNAVLLGEANVPPRDSRAYFAGGDGLHLMFNFWVNQHLFYALASGDARPLAQALRATARLPRSAQWAFFLRNHDELDLGRLPNEQREACFAAFAPEPKMQLYGRGIRRRLAPMLREPKRIELAYSLLFSLPGTPVLRYGEEIGMGEDLTLTERYAIRTPMQWSGEHNGGFSTAERTVLPVIEEGPYGYEHVNVAKQQRDPQALLRWLTRLIRLRTECPEIGWGDWRLLPVRRSSVLAIEYRWRGTTLVCIHNLSAEPTEIRIPMQKPEPHRLVNLIENEETEASEKSSYPVALDSFGSKWYRVDAINPALPRRRGD